MHTIKFDSELIRRYGGRGPRYTSYPPAVHFHDRFTEADYRNEVASSNEYPIPASLSLYLHIPFCESLCYYCACTKIVTRHAERSRDYLSHLHKEIRLQGALFDHDRAVRQLHLGGGTPTFLSSREMAELMCWLNEHFCMCPDGTREYSIEIDPRGMTESRFFELAELGFNRVSFGVQDFDPKVQAAVNRIQPFDVTEHSVAWARKAGFESVSLDLIYGLPFQTVKTFHNTLDQTLALRPERVAVYSYAHLPKVFRAQRLIKEDTLPLEKVKLELLRCAIERLGEVGYRYVGMDHFALPEDELVRAQAKGELHRNFQGYSTHAQCDLVGLGVSAISHVADCYSQNAKNLKTYCTLLDDAVLPVSRGLMLDDDDKLRGGVIQGLMCHGRVCFEDIQRRHSVDFEDYFSTELEALKPLQDDRLVEVSGDSITVTPRGWLVVRSVAMVFDRYLRRAPSRQTFSTVV